MMVDVRKLSHGAFPARPVYQHAHFCVRAFHLLISYPGYSLFIFFLIYIQIMDIRLYFKIRSRGSTDFTSSNTRLNQTNTLEVTHTIHIFDPLPIKKMMIEPMVSKMIEHF